MMLKAATYSLTLLLVTASCGQATDQSSLPEDSDNDLQFAVPAFAADPSLSQRDTSTWTYETFDDWKQACDLLPANRTLNRRFPPPNLLPFKTSQEFDQALEAAFDHFKNGKLTEADLWLNGGPEPSTFFDTSRVYFERNGLPFRLFAQRLEVPPNSKLFVHGDFHGDIHSFIAYLSKLNEQKVLDGFKLIVPDTSFLFLGDYTDRGVYGVEVIYTLLRLLLANPENVHLARGNHEDITLTAKYGFTTELAFKFGRNYDIRKPMRLYDFLPVVLYLGCGDNYVQCNHGGMEPGYNPAQLLEEANPIGFQLLGSLQQKSYFNKHPDFLESLDPLTRRQFGSQLRDFTPADPVTPVVLGFMWNDFSILRSDPPLAYDPNRAWVYGKSATEHILTHSSTDSHKLRAVIRAHQHSSLLNPMMRRLVACNGVHRHWQEGDNPALLNADPEILRASLETDPIRPLVDGSVFTLNVAPDSAYGIGCNYSFDTYAIVTTAEEFSDWTLEVHNVNAPKW
ncbi:MAG: hypothetical protein M2R45_04491 [Verrucomicrobia subdivision 3 bacterium]|nr:hypothetical protein [Limisphaerales bacterium]MCS1412665.1 hypothetical protein [Limisphaerales bacterium]